ncbi:hypothetical protein DQ393_20565 [Rhizobium tropici]|uniref:Uncharacterized protein n=1 Tax=Rhizobium tropici TaxID=398 RepID=A0A329Y6R4_RHITR|nr:hypothetical protein DQ393_20565 [Rhizobium tropici]
MGCVTRLGIASCCPPYAQHETAIMQAIAKGGGYDVRRMRAPMLNAATALRCFIEAGELA